MNEQTSKEVDYKSRSHLWGFLHFLSAQLSSVRVTGSGHFDTSNDQVTSQLVKITTWTELVILLSYLHLISVLIRIRSSTTEASDGVVGRVEVRWPVRCWNEVTWFLKSNKLKISSECSSRTAARSVGQSAIFSIRSLQSPSFFIFFRSSTNTGQLICSFLFV